MYCKSEKKIGIETKELKVQTHIGDFPFIND